MSSVTANELKTKGISAVESRLGSNDEVLISVRGKDKYVIMTLEKYDRLREHELDMAIAESRADYAAGRVITESVEDHVKRVTGDV
jgi:PHD/YefM family antitoxin component YafN of YafNO toxin-antitoxin module